MGTHYPSSTDKVMIWKVFRDAASEPYLLRMSSHGDEITQIAHRMREVEAKLHEPAIPISGFLRFLFAEYLPPEAEFLSVLRKSHREKSYVAVPATRRQHLQLTPIPIRYWWIRIPLIVLMFPALILISLYAMVFKNWLLPNELGGGWDFIVSVLMATIAVLLALLLVGLIFLYFSIRRSRLREKESPVLFVLPVELTAQYDALVEADSQATLMRQKSETKSDVVSSVTEGAATIVFNILGIAMLGAVVLLIYKLVSKFM